jgi:MFS family permease
MSDNSYINQAGKALRNVQIQAILVALAGGASGPGAGQQSVAVPGLAARILNGTGRVNVGQGAVMTMQGLGASLSPALGGFIAQYLGYRTAFLILGSFALGSVLLWLSFAATLKPACAGQPVPQAA